MDVLSYHIASMLTLRARRQPVNHNFVIDVVVVQVWCYPLINPCSNPLLSIWRTFEKELGNKSVDDHHGNSTTVASQRCFHLIRRKSYLKLIIHWFTLHVSLTMYVVILYPEPSRKKQIGGWSWSWKLYHCQCHWQSTLFSFDAKEELNYKFILARSEIQILLDPVKVKAIPNHALNLTQSSPSVNLNHFINHTHQSESMFLIKFIYFVIASTSP